MEKAELVECMENKIPVTITGSINACTPTYITKINDNVSVETVEVAGSTDEYEWSRVKRVEPVFSRFQIVQPTNKIEVELTDPEYLELYSFCKSINESTKDLPNRLASPIVSMASKMSDYFDANASLDMQANLAMAIEASERAQAKNPIAMQNIQNGMGDLMENFVEERKNLDSEFNNL